jgi:putative membrane protein
MSAGEFRCVYGQLMIRMLISFGISLLANAVGLLVAAWVLDDMSVSGTAFVIAVLIFTVVTVILQPLITKIAMQNAKALLGATALVTTLLGLIITSLISDGLEISGFTTWVLAMLIVWLAAMLAGLLLPVLLVKKAVEGNANNAAGKTYGR